MTIITHYDRASGERQGSYEQAGETPLHPFETSTPAPELQPHQAACRLMPDGTVAENGDAEGATWVVKPDWRNTTYWLNGEPHTILELGETVPEGASLTPPPPTLLEAKANRLGLLNSDYTTAIANLTAGYPEDEQKSWDKQEAEARAWTADNSTPTPYLSALAAARGITVAQLAPLVIANADAFALASATFIGRRQKTRDQINAATTVEAVNDVSWGFAL